MAVPIITQIEPVSGPASGGDLVRLTGMEFGPRVAVWFGDVVATVLSLRQDQGVSVADVRTSAHAEGPVDIVLRNVDASDTPIPGEEAILSAAYRYLRPRIIRESALTRLVRKLLRELKRQVMENASIAVALDYDDSTVDEVHIVALSRFPSLVLSGPRVSENRFFSRNELSEHMVPGTRGPELRRRRPPYTVDLSFTLTAASDRTTEVLNLMAAVATFLNRNRWIELPRDPDVSSAELLRWEMDPQGDFRTRLEGPDDVRAFTCGFVVRGFDIDEGLPLDVGKGVAETEITAGPLTNGESP
ncbi:MAG: IPT/TIG domain-containing protein [Proteobacteria bacterium]|nr:IPT/TIG domain-containing protein [Pseudomonadota bacterium]